MVRYGSPIALLVCLCAAARAEVEIPPGFEIVDVIFSEDQFNRAMMNDCGEIAFSRLLNNDPWKEEIFLYDNGSIRQITDNDVRDTWVEINNHGDLLWGRNVDDVSEPHQVILYRDGVETLIHEDSNWILGMSLNNRGEMVWSTTDYRRCPIPSWIYYFDGNQVQELVYEPAMLDQEPRINDDGWIVWMHTDFCESTPWAGTIQLYREGSIIDLPSAETQVQGAKINNLGQIVWDAQKDLELWSDGETIRLLDSDDVTVPNIGDSGVVSFSRGDAVLRVRNVWMYDSAARRPRFYRLTQDQRQTNRSTVNAWGEVAWLWYRAPSRGDFAGGFCLLRRIRTGDANFDGDIDYRDHKTFAKHITGPVRTDRLCDQRFQDIDHDGDLDLADFASIQNAFAP